ncbi:MAG: hypothetical protein PHS02_00320 [Candidatus ainarchaeum sp.]|nr:hypothetical protein [Candidatus ainarchaeum sp.]
MELSKNAKTLLMLLGVVVLVAAVYIIPQQLQALEPQVCTVNGECQHELFANELIRYMPLVLLLGIVIGAASYYFISERQPRTIAFRKEIAYSLLDSDERKVFAKIVESKGKVLQTELSRLEGIGKVKAHRIVERMEKKGIVEKEGFGKTNMIRLTRDLMGLFSP